MIQHYLPNRQVLSAVSRTLLTAKSRWAYVAMAFFNVMVIGGGGSLKGGGFKEFTQVAAGVLYVNLTIVWIWFALSLLTLNQSAAARLVPHYVKRLRASLFWLWVTIAGLTTLLTTELSDSWLGAALGSGFLLFFLVAPFRWPVRWCVAIFVIIPFLLQQLLDLPKGSLENVKPWIAPLELIALVITAWLVICLIHINGSKYADLLLRTTKAVGSTHKGASFAEPKLADLGRWGYYLIAVAHWVRLPFNLYASRLLSRPAFSKRNILARCELALGASPHWIGQLEMLVGLGLGMSLWVAFKQGGLTPLTPFTALHTSALTPYALLSAALLLFIALLPTASMGELMRQTTVEQKLQLLLPGMPQGNALTRKLARRHLIQAYRSWAVAAALTACLPFDAQDRVIAISGYLAVLILLPLSPTTNWAHLRPLSVERGLLVLISVLGLSGAIFAVQHFSHALLPTLLAVALAASLVLLNWRWMQVKRHPQAFPAGRLAQLQE